MAEHMGPAYLRYSFTKGTRHEVDALVAALGLEPGMSVLDVGCGPGRHAHELARRGIRAHGVDLSPRFVEVATADAPDGATFEVADARDLRFDGTFDAAISLCQGAFGSLGPPSDALADPQNLLGDRAVLAGMRRAVRPGGRAAVSAFSAYFQVRWLESTDDFDAATGLNVEDTEVADPSGRRVPARLWTTCSTPRELRMLLGSAGWEVDGVWSVAPGEYDLRPPTLERPELLVLAHRPT